MTLWALRRFLAIGLTKIAFTISWKRRQERFRILKKLISWYRGDLLENMTVAQLVTTSLAFYGNLPCSQKPVTGSYAVLATYYILFTTLFNIIVPSTTSSLKVVLFLQFLN